jgi:hypothetical protein
VKIREFRSVISQSDTSDYTEYHDSPDNGRTWGEWIRKNRLTKERVGNDEIAEDSYSQDHNVWNPVHKHCLSLVFQTIYIDGYEVSSADYWSGGQGPVEHTYLEIADRTGAMLSRQFIAYEKGAPFDKDTYRSTDYLTTNFCIGTGMCILKNGDIIFGLWTPVDVCCRRAGLDINEVTPSIPKQPNGLLACRGKWNRERKQYVLALCGA